MRIRLLFLLLAGVMTACGGQALLAAAPATELGTFVVDGNVQNPLTLTVEQLAAMPTQEVTVEFETGDGLEEHTYTGVPLIALLEQAELGLDPDVKNDKLRHYVAVAGSDGYVAVVAYGEIDPEFGNRMVLLAVTEDGASLAAEGPRLVVPGDVRGGRYVTNVVRVSVARADIGP